MKLTGKPEGATWLFSENTVEFDVSGTQLSKMYIFGSRHLSSLNDNAKSYVYTDDGYGGCVTLVQYDNSYEYVEVLAANDSDVIKAGRTQGKFPPEHFYRVREVEIGNLPSRIIRPW
jgi:hypothetical protein